MLFLDNMISININEIDTQGLECFEAVVGTIANYYERECHLIKIGQWTFRYEYKEGNAIGESINEYFVRNNDCLKVYHGLEFYMLSYHDIGLAIKNNYPVICEVDLFDCYWDKDFKRYHFLHYILIYAMDFKNRCFFCMDPFWKKSDIVIKFSEFNNIVKKCYLLNKKETKKYNFYHELEKEVAFYKNSKAYDNLLTFSDDMVNKLEWEKEIKDYGKDLFAVPLLNKMRILITNREGYIRMLSIENEKNNGELILCLELGRIIVDEWKKIRIKLMKDSILKRTGGRYGELFKRINELEFCFWEKIEDCCNGL